MESDSPRAIALAAAPQALGLSPAAVIASADGSPHARGAAERGRAGRPWRARCRPMRRSRCAATSRIGSSPPSHARFRRGCRRRKGAALARRAPVDLRVNTLKADRDKVLKALARFAAETTPLLADRRAAARPGRPGRQPNVEAEVGHGRGWYEVQDEGSQLAALMADAAPRQQVLDICAGAGGKTLAFAAAMRNTGQVYAYDDDAVAPAADLRAAETGRRAQRPGARRPATQPRLTRARPPLRSRCSSTPPARAAAPGGGGRTPSGG